MKNLWNDRHAAQAKDQLDLLVYRSRLIGSEPKLCVWGGGNTSTKMVQKDHRGRTQLVLRIKGSGSDLKASTRSDFPPVAVGDLLDLLKRKQMSDEEMVDYVKHCLLDPKAPRPSIEVLLHAFVDQPDIDHTHADAILSITNTKHGRSIARRVFGSDLIWIPYVKPGFTLAKRMALAYRLQPEAKGAILEKHGLITWGRDAQTSYARTIEMISKAERYLTRARRKKRYWNPPAYRTESKARRDAWLFEMLPVIRRVVNQKGKKVLVHDDSPDVLAFVNARDSRRISQAGPATPDHMLRTKRLPLYLDLPGRDLDRLNPQGIVRQIESYAQAHERYFKNYRSLLGRAGFIQMLDPYPKVILVPGVGMITIGGNVHQANVVAEIYKHSISVMTQASVIDTYASLSERLAFEIEYWPLELYKLSLAPLEAECSGHVGLVTGAARGIGRAISEKLVSLGAHVFLADLDFEAVCAQAEAINQKLKTGHATAVRMDVTKAESVGAGFQQLVLETGGLDFVVSNAGMAHVSSVEKMKLDDWQRSFAVNATGHFLVAREAVRLLKRQGTGGSLVFIASKNVLAPGKDFGAYSAAKAAEAQLARILAIENGEYGIRANIVNPDGVFEDSGLWEHIGGDRAKSYGISRHRLEDYYRNRNLLKTRVFPQDVAESVAFLISTKSAKTTGCILTVDGGIKEAFPR